MANYRVNMKANKTAIRQRRTKQTKSNKEKEKKGNGSANLLHSNQLLIYI
jgi:hypothetical protein